MAVSILLSIIPLQPNQNSSIFLFLNSPAIHEALPSAELLEAGKCAVEGRWAAPESSHGLGHPKLLTGGFRVILGLEGDNGKENGN